MIYFFYTLLFIYVFSLSYIAFYCAMQFLLFWKMASKQKTNTAPPLLTEFPFVSIQLPIYNEMYVVERLLDCIFEINYPHEKLEIQILDDSTDETSDLIAKKIKNLPKGLNISHLRRTERLGYKAGALQAATSLAKGEFIAIFDADFLPKHDFLMHTLPLFQDPKVGVVQTRWGHLNAHYSLLTRLQAFQLNVHFRIEQTGRQAGNYFLQFNGTAGVWRKNAIEDAGGWHADTLTEDLDLSYRAQLAGWKIAYLDEVTTPAELPADIHGLKSQQFRWIKGGAENFVKLLPSVLKSNLSLSQKTQAISHLSASSTFLFVLLAGTSSVPLTYFFSKYNIQGTYLNIFILSLILIFPVYAKANWRYALPQRNTLLRLASLLTLFFIFLSLSVGLALHNSLALLQGYMRKKTPFVRTPKFNLTKQSDDFLKKKYRKIQGLGVTIAEGILALYFLLGIALAWHYSSYHFIVFHSMLFIGFSCVFSYSIKHSKS